MAARVERAKLKESAGSSAQQRGTSEMRALIVAIVLALAVGGVRSTPVRADTTHPGPYGSTFTSGLTICDTQKPFGFTELMKRILVEPPGLHASFFVPTGSKVRWTVFVRMRPANSTTWIDAGGWYKDGSVTLTAGGHLFWSFGVMNVSVDSKWSGEVRTKEQLHVVDAYGRPYVGSGAGPYWESEYRTRIYSYSPSFNSAWDGVCAF